MSGLWCQGRKVHSDIVLFTTPNSEVIVAGGVKFFIETYSAYILLVKSLYCLLSKKSIGFNNGAAIK